MTRLNKAWLSTGSNMGKREALLHKAIELIEESCGKVLLQSALYQTAAWGKQDQPPFLNQALLIETSKPAEDLLACLLQVELTLGRHRAEKYGPRLIDIDIIFFNNDVVRQPHLTIPHPHAVTRRFVLLPLAEISPEYVHPVLQKSVAQLLDECPDLLAVQKWNAG